MRIKINRVIKLNPLNIQLKNKNYKFVKNDKIDKISLNNTLLHKRFNLSKKHVNKMIFEFSEFKENIIRDYKANSLYISILGISIIILGLNQQQQQQQKLQIY